MTDDELVVLTGFEDCILGLAERFGMPTVVAYDYEKVLAKLEADGMDPQDVQEYFEYNILGAWVGETTPIFVSVGARP